MKKEELKKMEEDVNESMEKIYKKNFPDFEPLKIKIKLEEDFIEENGK